MDIARAVSAQRGDNPSSATHPPADATDVVGGSGDRSCERPIAITSSDIERADRTGGGDGVDRGSADGSDGYPSTAEEAPAIVADGDGSKGRTEMRGPLDTGLTVAVPVRQTLGEAVERALGTEDAPSRCIASPADSSHTRRGDAGIGVLARIRLHARDKGGKTRFALEDQLQGSHPLSPTGGPRTDHFGCALSVGRSGPDGESPVDLWISAPDASIRGKESVGAAHVYARETGRPRGARWVRRGPPVQGDSTGGRLSGYCIRSAGEWLFVPDPAGDGGRGALLVFRRRGAVDCASAKGTAAWVHFQTIVVPVDGRDERERGEGCDEGGEGSRMGATRSKDGMPFSAGHPTVAAPEGRWNPGAIPTTDVGGVAEPLRSGRSLGFGQFLDYDGGQWLVVGGLLTSKAYVYRFGRCAEEAQPPPAEACFGGSGLVPDSVADAIEADRLARRRGEEHRPRWNLFQTLEGNGYPEGALRVAISGDTIFVCEPVPEGPSPDRRNTKVDVFRMRTRKSRGGAKGKACRLEWQLSQALRGFDADPVEGVGTDWFGMSLSVRGDVGIVGAPLDSRRGAFAGACYFIEKVLPDEKAEGLGHHDDAVSSESEAAWDAEGPKWRRGESAEAIPSRVDREGSRWDRQRERDAGGRARGKGSALLGGPEGAPQGRRGHGFEMRDRSDGPLSYREAGDTLMVSAEAMDPSDEGGDSRGGDSGGGCCCCCCRSSRHLTAWAGAPHGAMKCKAERVTEVASLRGGTSAPTTPIIRRRRDSAGSELSAGAYASAHRSEGGGGRSEGGSADGGIRVGAGATRGRSEGSEGSERGGGVREGKRGAGTRGDGARVWRISQKVYPPGGHEHRPPPYFGCAVAMGDRLAVVGDPERDGMGAVQVFKQDSVDGFWAWIETLTDPNPCPGGRFGAGGIAMAQGFLAVGSNPTLAPAFALSGSRGPDVAAGRVVVWAVGDARTVA